MQGSTPLAHARPSLIASCDTAGGLPATADSDEDADSGSTVLVPVDTRWAERGRAIARWCADRLTALLTATLTAVLTDELRDGFFGSAITQDWLAKIRVVRDYDGCVVILLKPSRSMYDARFTSEPFSSVLMTCAFLDPPGVEDSSTTSNCCWSRSVQSGLTQAGVFLVL